jgi:hypothetical protein
VTGKPLDLKTVSVSRSIAASEILEEAPASLKQYKNPTELQLCMTGTIEIWNSHTSAIVPETRTLHQRPSPAERKLRSSVPTQRREFFNIARLRLATGT